MIRFFKGSIDENTVGGENKRVQYRDYFTMRVEISFQWCKTILVQYREKRDLSEVLARPAPSFLGERTNASLLP